MQWVGTADKAVILRNSGPISLDFLVWTIPEIPKLVIVILATFMGGALWEIEHE